MHMYICINAYSLSICNMHIYIYIHIYRRATQKEGCQEHIVKAAKTFNSQDPATIASGLI